MKNVEKLFESKGVNVYIQNGKVIISDDQERNEYPDTEENRKMCIKQAKKIISVWEKE